MNRFQRLIGGLGVLGVCLGLAMIFLPQFAALLTTRRLLIPVVGLLALIQAIRIVQDRRSVRITQAAMPALGAFASSPSPGATFENPLISTERGNSIERGRAKRKFREQLSEAALTVLTHRTHVSRDEARQQIETGAWTADPYAAAFLSTDQQTSMDWLMRLRLRLRSESSFEWKAQRTMDAIVRIGDSARGDFSQ